MLLDAPFLQTEATERLAEAFAGFELRFVGGCVRNLVLGRPVTDLDLATDATPGQMLALGNAAGLTTHPTGVDHGTVTFVVDGLPHEITTYRRDIETNGRHAQVAFSTRLEEDASRRDFTMNALYLTLAGQLIDPVSGLDDTKAGRVRFIGSPAERIREDYLRILRFFRFTAHYGTPSEGIDADGLAACAEHASGLTQISAERITAELTKLLEAKRPAPAVASMAAAGALALILPGSSPTLLAPFADLSPYPREPMACLAALGGDPSHLRLSKRQAKDLDLFQKEMVTITSPEALSYAHGAPKTKAIVALRSAAHGSPLPDNLGTAVTRGASAAFPVRAADLMPKLSGAALGEALNRLESTWIASNFTLTRDELLSQFSD
ncbi:MAG: CCA tRNA nucleotidyltransferase [Pseudomonadota bacterium]